MLIPDSQRRRIPASELAPSMIDPDDPGDSKPRRLPSLKTEYDRLWDELGGPADIGIEIPSPKIALKTYCSELPSSNVLPLFLKFQPDRSLALKHWPWAAFAIGQYAFERNELKEYRDEPSPKEVDALLCHIIRTSQDLRSALVSLEALSSRLNDRTAPLRRAHIGWLNAIVSQGVAGYALHGVNEDGDLLREVNEDGDLLHEVIEGGDLLREVNEDGDLLHDVIEDGVHLFKVDAGKQAFLERLTEIESAAGVARGYLDKALLHRDRGQSAPGLSNFVFLCGAIWKSLTGRKPSANKVARASDHSSDPDFVLLVQGLARLGGARVPSRRQVAAALRQVRTPN